MIGRILYLAASIAATLLGVILGTHLLAAMANVVDRRESVLTVPLSVLEKVDVLVLPAAFKLSQVLSQIPGYNSFIDFVLSGHPDAISNNPLAFLLIFVVVLSVVWNALTCLFHVRITQGNVSPNRNNPAQALTEATRDAARAASLEKRKGLSRFNPWNK